MSERELTEQEGGGGRMSLESALDVLAAHWVDQVVVGTMTANGAWMQRAPGDLNLACIGFMGGASALGLGVALAQPQREVWVIDGDGSLMMQLGSLGTIAGAAPENFVHFVIHNGVYETSGAQPLPSQERVNFAAMAAGAGYQQTASFSEAEGLDAALDDLLAAPGPILIELRTRPGGKFFAARPTPPGAVPALARMWPPVAARLAEAEDG